MNILSGNKRKEIINLGLFSISLIPILLYFYVLSQRITLPLDLEWGEGSGINQIFRILSGEKLYIAPSLDFAPLVYTPLYYYLASLLARLGLPIALAGRLLSGAASFGSAGIIARVVVRESGNRFAGWLASALYLACFVISDGFFDLVRVDSLYVFIVLLIFLLLMNSSKKAGKLIAGLAIALGFYIKQSALILFFPIILYLLFEDWKSTWPLLLTTVLGVLVPIYLVDGQTGGWFSYYILRLPREHGYSLISAINFWIGDLAKPLGIAIGFGLIYLLLRWEELIPGRQGRKQDEDQNQSAPELGTASSHRLRLFALFAIGAICASWITRASNGGGANNIMPAYAAISIFFGLGYNEVGNLLKKEKVAVGKFPIILAGLAAIQFVGLIYNPFNFIPSSGEVRANEDLLGYLSELSGTAWIPYRSHLPLLAGRSSTIHAVNLFELTGYFKGDVLPEGNDLVQQIRENVCGQSYDLIMLDQPIPWIEDQLSTAYEQDGRFAYLESERRSPVLAWQGGYEAFYIPRQDYNPEVCFGSIPGDENN